MAYARDMEIKLNVKNSMEFHSLMILKIIMFCILNNTRLVKFKMINRIITQ